MKGFVPTPAPVVRSMVAKLFADRPPTPDDLVIDPGCGEGEFVDGVLAWCRRESVAPPRILGVELHPGRAQIARARFAEEPTVEIREADFLNGKWPTATYVIGNPPYVAITKLSETEKERYRNAFATAYNRFDLYFLFIEQGLRLLQPDGRLVFITPEKYLTVTSARPVRQLLAQRAVREVELLDERTFSGLTTYPSIMTVDDAPSEEPARLIRRDGTVGHLLFEPTGRPLTQALYGSSTRVTSGPTLGDVCLRVSCGVATGADAVFVRGASDLEATLRRFARPTIAGKQLGDGDAAPADVMLVPYDEAGQLLERGELGALGCYLETHRARLERRTCTRRKPWYAFHETPPLEAMLRPKLLCKDIAATPQFWTDAGGRIVPRHSVYYLVPNDASLLGPLAVYLNGPEAKAWLEANCQRAANGYLRLQSTVLKRLPIPTELTPDAADLPLFADTLATA